MKLMFFVAFFLGLLQSVVAAQDYFDGYKTKNNCRSIEAKLEYPPTKLVRTFKYDYHEPNQMVCGQEVLAKIKSLCLHVIRNRISKDRAPTALPKEIIVSGKVSYLSEKWHGGILTGNCESPRVEGQGFPSAEEK